MMAERIDVISGDLDGAQLRRAQSRKLWTRADGKEDDEQINDAINHQPSFSIPGHLWERVFGRKL